MDAKRYKITCLNCGGASRVNIVDGRHILYIDHLPIIACRLRGDLKWGFECQCGNDSRLAREEESQAEMLVQGGKHALERLIEGLKIKDADKFTMELA